MYACKNDESAMLGNCNGQDVVSSGDSIIREIDTVILFDIHTEKILMDRKWCHS